MTYNIYNIRCQLATTIAIVMANRATEEDHAENYGRWLLGGDFLCIELAD